MAALPSLLLLLATVPPSGGVPERVFEPAALPAGPPARSLSVRESDGSVLEARGDRLVRRRAGRETELRSTAPGGTGPIRAFAPDPTGVTWIAAGEGIFLASPETGVADPLELKKGAPPGRPVGLHLDRKRRLWIATDTSFGVIDAGTLEGRTFTPADGLPASPPRGLAAAADGSLLLITADGAYRYRPDTGSRPTVSITTVNGRPHAPGRPVTFEYPGSLTLTLSGTGLGGPAFRILPSERGRYKIGSLEGSTAVLERIDPGRRVVEVVAVDRDLNVSAPAAVTVDVSWPFFLRPPFVAATGLAAAAAVLAVFLLAARRSGGGRPAYARAAVSAFLAPVLGLQILAGLVPHARGWPFVGFSMYTRTSGEGRVVGYRILEALGRDGSARPVNTWGIFAAHLSQVVHPLLTGRSQGAGHLVRIYNERSGRPPIVGFRLRAYRHRLTADGPVRIAPLTVYQYLEETRWASARPGTASGSAKRRSPGSPSSGSRSSSWPSTPRSAAPR